MNSKLSPQVIKQLTESIESIWENEIKNDYNQEHILKEDALKCCFYHHLRDRLSDGWFIRHRLRIYPEYYLKEDNIADIAIVRVTEKPERKGKRLKDCVESLVAIIEFKYKYGNYTEHFISDRKKLQQDAVDFPETKLFACFIHEQNYTLNQEKSFFHEQQSDNWAKGRVVELFGYWDECDNYQTVVKKM